ncbi:hypothetical protein BT96DRAFT_341413 [Gymnopus androsaceus JB14]|uniref:Uncharacterized protein n=1 Tax=Gymnopus androsaceus JB14 TaxID=1447944 RepID=A0A6A4GXS9_9AGAR|nr:hypothetical protein BT96DRAFT_341413 [Gymnopus androsaceus JB14]
MVKVGNLNALIAIFFVMTRDPLLVIAREYMGTSQRHVDIERSNHPPRRRMLILLLDSVVKHTLQHTRDSVGQCDAASVLPQVRAGFYSEARMILPPPGARTSIASDGPKLKETSPSTGTSDSDTFFPLTPPPRDSDDKCGPVRTLPYPISNRSPGVRYKERAPGVVG